MINVLGKQFKLLFISKTIKFPVKKNQILEFKEFVPQDFVFIKILRCMIKLNLD